jgi:hypothetical protein
MKYWKGIERYKGIVSKPCKKYIFENCQKNLEKKMIELLTKI